MLKRNIQNNVIYLVNIHYTYILYIQSWAFDTQIVLVLVLGTQKRVPSVLMLSTQKGSKVLVLGTLDKSKNFKNL